MTLRLRLTSAQRDAVTLAAHEAGLSISGWVVARLAEKRETPPA